MSTRVQICSDPENSLRPITVQIDGDWWRDEEGELRRFRNAEEVRDELAREARETSR